MADKYKYFLSLDISTSNVGVALWDEYGDLVELKHLSLKINRKDYDPEYRDLIKCDLFEDYFLKYKEHIENYLDGYVDKIIVEAPLPNTKININTTSLLLGFNGMARRDLYKIFNIMPIKLTVHEIRKIFCNEFIVRKKNKKTGKIEETLSFPKGWKANEKKRYIWEKVTKLEPDVKWFYKKDSSEPKDICFDMSDAYACGYAQLKLDGVI